MSAKRQVSAYAQVLARHKVQRSVPVAHLRRGRHANRNGPLLSGGGPELGGYISRDPSPVFDLKAVCFSPVAYLHGAEPVS